MRAEVVVVGSFAVDVSFRAARLPGWGETLMGSGFALGPGGKGSNQAVAAARAGSSVALVTAVGADAFGETGREIWAAEGIDASLVRTADVPTGAAAILLDERTGENAILVVPGACGSMGADDAERAAEVIQGAKVLLVQLEIPMDAVERALQLARAAGVASILNPAPAAAVPEAVLRLVDYLIPNETEAAQLGGVPVGSDMEARAAAARLLQRGAGKVIVTMGERGSVLCGRGDEMTKLEAFRAGPVVETTGAGDAFCGAFAVGLAEGRTAVEAMRFASAAAGISVTRAGTASSMARREEILRALKATQ